MKPLFALSLVLFTFGVAAGQTLPNAFKVGNYVEVLPNDSIKIWYNCVGAISNRNCASFYRLGKIDPETIGVTGEFRDYDVNGHLIYKAQMHNSKLSGKAWFYYPDGQVKETGEYVNDERKGVWKYYYDNGSAEKVFDFEGGTPDIIQAYDLDGKPTVSDGNGNYSGRFAAVGQCDGSWPISGAVKNGKMDGEWNFAVLSTELYDNGKFIKGTNSKNYGGGEYSINQPRIKVSGFYANEETQLYENHAGCPGDRITLFKFGSKSLTAGLYPDMIKKIKSYPSLKNQWLIIAITFNSSDHIKTLDVYSSKDDTELERFIYGYIKNLRGWQPWSATSESNPPLFFTINIDLSLGAENVMIPAEYMIRQQMKAMQLPEGR